MIIVDKTDKAVGFFPIPPTWPDSNYRLDGRVLLKPHTLKVFKGDVTTPMLHESDQASSLYYMTNLVFSAGFMGENLKVAGVSKEDTEKVLKALWHKTR